MQLMEYVRALENRGNQARGEQVLNALGVLGIEPVVQECRWPQIRNIIVDFSPDREARRLLFSAHYDAVKGSPGANDNASGVAVLLGLCYEIRHSQVPVRVIFFDREEAWLRTPLLRMGLLGSLFYVWKNDLRNVDAVYNLEFCGLGDFLGIWPVRNGKSGLAAIKEIEKATTRLGLPFESVHIPWLFLSSDHLPFRLRGVSNAVTLSLLPSGQVKTMENLLASLSVPRLAFAQRPPLPEPLSLIHTAEDTSSNLNENSLRLMLSVLLELIQR